MNKRLRNAVVGVAVLIVGVAGLLVPVSASDGQGSTVPCGNAVTASPVLTPPVPPAPVVDPAAPQPGFVPDLAVACESAISDRRHWAVPLVIVGVGGVLVGLFLGRRRSSD